mgnify:CR=1 FL=1
MVRVIPIDAEKTCTRCGGVKTRADFYRMRHLPNAIHSICKECEKTSQKVKNKTNPARLKMINRRSKLKRAFGITLEQYAEMLQAQGNCCAICKTKKPGGKDNVFHVDHCHLSGHIRGLLCHFCNVGLGHFKEEPKLLNKAMGYLLSGGYFGIGS